MWPVNAQSLFTINEMMFEHTLVDLWCSRGVHSCMPNIAIYRNGSPAVAIGAAECQELAVLRRLPAL